MAKNNLTIWSEQSETASIRDKRDKNSEKVKIEGSQRLENFVQQNSPVNNELVRNSVMNDLLHTNIDGQVTIIPTEVITRAAHGSVSQVITLCSFSYAEDVDAEIFGIRGANKITAYDRRVYNAVSSLFLNGRTTVSLNEIYNVMTGYSRARPSKGQVDAIERCLKKLSSVNVSIDFTDELRSKIIKDKKPLIDAGILKNSSDKFKKAMIDDKMIHIRIGTVESEQGNVFKCVQVLDEPALLTYNRAKKTLLTIPMRFIGLQGINATEKTIAFQDYLLVRIISFKNGKMHSNKVLYSTLYADSGIEKPEDGKSFMRDRETIRNMMEEWKKCGLVSSYAEFKKGKSFAGIIFNVEKENQEQEDE